MLPPRGFGVVSDARSRAQVFLGAGEAKGRAGSARDAPSKQRREWPFGSAASVAPVVQVVVKGRGLGVGGKVCIALPGQRQRRLSPVQSRAVRFSLVQCRIPPTWPGKLAECECGVSPRYSHRQVSLQPEAEAEVLTDFLFF